MCRAGDKPLRRTKRGKPERGARAFDGDDRAPGDTERFVRGQVAECPQVCQKEEAKASRQDRRVEYLLTRSIQRSLENDKLQRDQEDMEGLADKPRL